MAREPLTVLVVEAGRAVRGRLVELLAVHPDVGEVVEAWRVRAAIALLRSASPDVLVSDIVLGADDGLALFEQAAGLVPPPLRIAVTAYAAPQWRDRCMRLGVEHFLDRDVELDRLDGILTAYSQSREGGHPQ